MIVGKSLLKEVITALKPKTFKTRLNRVPVRTPTAVAGTMVGKLTALDTGKPGMSGLTTNQIHHKPFSGFSPWKIGHSNPPAFFSLKTNLSISLILI